ncbi:unnamed protein product [Medioppia subpectinata]|uniref:F-box domain-containing protein n=1 Tax=Medioppia subpectinata TaxID=1979941 RepID=A0A7R9KJ49_9ACAR|nr:unnamed protein product [Medioppia subpectinata]CAG2103337.1 unnamed protein product [Medioppia subpectinata]
MKTEDTIEMESQSVFDNHLLLEQIFRHIGSIRHLKSTSRVCKLWHNCCDREVRHRCHRRLTHHLFYCFPVESSVSSDLKSDDNPNDDKPFVLTDGQAVVDRIGHYYKNGLQLIPQLVVMFNAKLSRDDGSYSALNLDTYRRFLPKECLFIRLENQTIIGTSDHNRSPYPAANGLAGISHLLMAKTSGLSIDVYYDQEICQSLRADPDIKCILYYESCKDFDRKDSAGHYMWSNCNHHMWDVMKELKYKLAFGGTRVAAIDVSRGHEPSSEATKPFACVVIRGPTVSACSIEMKTGSAESTKRLLTEFKSRLGFDADDHRLSTTVAFVFCRIIPYRFNRYCHFKEGESSQLIHEVFPNVVFAGVISVINFGHDFWPALPFKSDEDSNYRTTLFDSTIIIRVALEWISGGGCQECLHNELNHRIADNYGLCSTHSLVNNGLIMENIFKWLEISELIKCSDVCLKWRKSMDEVIDSYNHYLSSNRLNEFKFIIVFSKLDFNQMQEFLANQRIPNDCTVVHINCRNEVIGTQEVVPRSGRSVAANHHIEYESDFDLLSGISTLFMSRAMPGIEVLLYRDSTILDLKFDAQLKCIVVFHIQRSFYGHFSRLKTDSQYLEYLEQLIHDCNNNNTVAFGGVTVDRLASAQTTHSDRDII